jgi:hypothetical protein
MGGACSTYGDRRRLYWAFVRKHKGRTQLGRHRRRWYGIFLKIVYKDIE